MTKQLGIHKVKKHVLMFLAVLYIATPLHKTLQYGFHKLEHAITQSADDHGHYIAHELDKEHAHKHKFIAFFDSVFSSETEPSENNKVTTEIKIDKHITSSDFAFKGPQTFFSEHIFFYTTSSYSNFLDSTTPPPETSFS